MNLLYMHPTGPMLRVDSEHTLHIDDLNPEIKTRWRLSRWELISIGWGLIMSAVFRPDPDRINVRAPYAKAMIDMLAALVKAERDRCAEIADLYVSQARPAGDENVGDCPLTAHFDGQRIVAQNIGHDIRNGL